MKQLWSGGFVYTLPDSASINQLWERILNAMQQDAPLDVDLANGGRLILSCARVEALMLFDTAAGNGSSSAPIVVSSAMISAMNTPAAMIS
jgi:hypothetical protein